MKNNLNRISTLLAMAVGVCAPLQAFADCTTDQLNGTQIETLVQNGALICAQKAGATGGGINRWSEVHQGSSGGALDNDQREVAIV